MKIYETECYQRTLQTVVTYCEKVGEKILLQLQDTIFFPEEGGQYADRGWLVYGEEQACVLDGHLKKGEIFYEVDREIPVGTEVECRLDWELRFTRMQQHTGEHILTGVIHNTFGYDNVGFHLSDDSPVTLDMNGELTAEQVQEMERLANEAVFADLPVQITFPSKDELTQMDYRSKIDIPGQVRIITVGEFDDPIDVCACCAPHLSHTGEVGLIKVISAQRYKGGVRIGILCGRRALEHYRREWNRMNQIARFFSGSPEQIMDSLQSQKSEIAALRGELAARKEAELMRRIEALPESTHACLCLPELSSDGMKRGFNTMAEKFPGYVGVFVGDDASGYRYYAGSIARDSRELAKIFREKLGAKGGGNADMIQGKAMVTAEQIREFFAALG